MRTLSIDVALPAGARWMTYDADGALRFWQVKPTVFDLFTDEGEEFDAEYDAREGFWEGQEVGTGYETGIPRPDYRATLKRITLEATVEEAR